MHSIRLRGPWEFSIRGTQITGRIVFPCSWPEMIAAVSDAKPTAVFLAEPLAVMLVRRFNKPTGLEEGNRVALLLRHCSPSVTAQLNGSPLTLREQSAGSHQADVTSLLGQRNELAVALEPPSPAPLDSIAPILEATLEIYPV